ncbi:MAG: S53 family peptidase, partial [Acidobacteriota bacterium]|nr:S53 family peptidase [Acidobacteriota bacterium]
MPFEQKVALPGSERTPLAGAHETGPVDPQEPIQVTVVLRRREGSIDHDLALVRNFAAHHGLTVVNQSAPARTVTLSGSPEALGQAFGTRLAMFHVPSTGVTYRGRTGSVLIPAELEPAVLAVLGLDSRPIAKPHFRVAAHATPAGALTPIQVAQLYSFPAGRTGAGQTVAIIELGGGYRTEDLDAYFSALGLKTPSVTAVPVDGAANQPGSAADGEVMLDIEVVGAVAPGATIAVYFAPNTDQGFFDAVTAAAHDSARKPSVISISWGASEDVWTAQARDSLNSALQDAATLGITVTVASGDDGSADGVADGKVHVDFPSSSPFVLSCGGTRLNAQGGKITSEVVWNE